ncbi:hypothetical protein FNV43_RR09842 [Rhamnella rubrinervis]|uniref:DUF1985 domain-containing protein n=1 Tax=Rhamnella rubrinervis TaxID=2594499 RepID=A0A8K0HBI8_9ROSA|nr:hypothetical protein FNV43_RR09842 [Rhamnella rubrinervis]
MAEAKPLKYTNALMVKDSRAHVASKSTIIQCIHDIDRKFVQDPDHPSRIKARQRKKFEESCFGTLFLRMHNIVLNAGIIHNMIARQAESLNEGAMEFNFNGNGAIFTRKEFGIITSLKMENTLDIQPPPYSDRIRNTYFGHIHRIKNRDVRNVFMHIKQNRLEYEDDFVRLALIYFLECGVLGKKSQVCINLDYLSMVEDLNYFNQYSWGLVSYNATLISLHKALDLHHGELNKSSTYSLGGFPLAFQVWGYETIPLMGKLFATKVDNSYPRICNWKAERIYKFQDVAKMIFESGGETSIEDVGQPSHSSYNYDELKSCIEALGIKIDGVANDLGTKIDGVASDLGNFRLESMCQYQSIHNTMGEMFDYIKHAYHGTNHATHTDDVNEDMMVHENFETRNVITAAERQLNLTTSMPPPTDFNPKDLPNEVQIKFLTYLTSNDDVTLDYNVCDVNKQFFKEMVEDSLPQALLTQLLIVGISFLFLQTSASASSPKPSASPTGSPPNPAPGATYFLCASSAVLRPGVMPSFLLYDLLDLGLDFVSMIVVDREMGSASKELLKLERNNAFSSLVLGKVRDFLGVISEANEKLKVDSKENSVNYDIEVLTRNESQIIEMDLMLGIADLHTPEVVVAAESSITGCQPVIPLAVSSSGTESEDSSNGNDDSDY